MAISSGVSVWVLDAPGGFGDASPHAHHAIQLTICLDGELSLIGEGRTIAAQAIAVAADIPHRLQAAGQLAIIFVEPESPAGRRLAETLFADETLVAVEEPALVAAAGALRSALDDPATRADMLAAGSAAVDALAAVPPSGFGDRRIDAIIRFVAENIDRPLTLDLAARAAGVHLSSSRLRHLFVEQTGLAFRTYQLWLRLVRAVDIYSEGATLTQAAHAAGFADSAHFSRTFRRTFGSPANTLRRL